MIYQTGLATIDILALDATVLALAVKSAEVDKRTLFAYVPYLAWLSYASYLCGGVWYLNGGEEKVKKAERDLKGKGRAE